MEQFRPKSPEELQEQLDSTSETLNTGIVQESAFSGILNLSLEEIKSKYPERYEVYLKLLRAQKNNQEIYQEELHEMNTWISALNNLDAYIVKHHNIHEELDSRSKKQLDVFEDIRDSLEEGKKEGYIKLPTGVGKTVLFSKITEALGLKTLIVVPSKILVNQTGERMEQFTDIEFGKFYQTEKDLSKNVTVITYNSLIAGVKNGTINESDYDALILDEAHKALGDETVKAIERFSAVKLGFTATPKYSRKKHVSDLLEHEIHTMDVLEAVREGFISRFKSYIAYTDIDLSSVQVKNREQYNETQLEKAINQKSRNQSAVELYKNQFEGQLAVAYCGGVDHARDVAKEFNDAGISAEVISGTTPDDESPSGKKAILKRFNSGETKVLCNARILIEGFDEPKMSVCLNLHPTLSLVDAEQRAGRALRLDSDNPDKWAYIVDFIDQNSAVPPLTFAAIAEASEASEESEVSTRERQVTESDEIQEVKSRERIRDLDIKGLRVVVDAQEVLSVSNEFEIERNREKMEFLPFETLKEEVQKSGIFTTLEYKKVQKNIQTWPSKPNITYAKSGWTSWEDFVGKKEKFISLRQLKEEVQNAGILSNKEYKEEKQKHPDWPSEPYNTYLKKGWVSWPDLFGIKEINFLSLEALKEEVKKEGISKFKEYKEARTKHPNWPSGPSETYKNAGWISFNDLFDKKVDVLSLEALKEEVKKLGISSFSKYKEARVDHPNWPLNPERIYKNAGWISFLDLLGKEELNFPPLEVLKEEIKEAGISSITEYNRARVDHPNWPAAPYKMYKNSGWVAWSDLFGK